MEILKNILFSFSKHGVLREYNIDLNNYKLIQCLYGKIQFVLFDTRKNYYSYEKGSILLFSFRRFTSNSSPRVVNFFTFSF